MKFEIDRESLFGQPMGFAPEPDVKPAAVAQPELGEPLTLETAAPPPQELVVAPPPAELSAPAEPEVALEPKPELAEPEPDLAASEASSVVDTAAGDDAAAAVEEVIQINPTAVASINEPEILPKPAARPLPGVFRLERTKMVEPEYPRDAALVGQEGWVDLLVTVDPSGRVSDVNVADAKPRRVFDSAARRAAMQWEFRPPAESGVGSAQQAMFRLKFVLN
ncbi:MAG: TonB family protein [Pseudomonadota bacterium]